MTLRARPPTEVPTRWLTACVLLFAGVAGAQTSSDTGGLTLTARVSGYVDIASGGPATLGGAVGGSISGNTAKGDRLTTAVVVALGDLSPVNTNPFVTLTVPVRLRSNIDYTLSMSTTGFGSADPLAIQAADVGFGVTNVVRTDVGVNAAGTDTLTAGVAGTPAADPDANAATPRWDFAAARSLGTYTTSRQILAGTRIMNAVPASLVGGLTLNTLFVVKPQFFSPGSFSTTITFTIATP
jgi:hypothetical protein